MKQPFTIENYLSIVRELYKSEKRPLVQGHWLKLGIILKEMIDNREVAPFDEATEEFENRLFEKMEETK